MAVLVEGARAGARCIWGAPVFDQVRVGWDETRKACSPVGSRVHFRESRMETEFATGGRIIFRSLDNPDNARGHTADIVAVDEVADVNPKAWYEVLRPMLIDTGGQAWLFGTPKGRNWFYQEHTIATERADSMAWQAPTLGVAITSDGLVRRPHPLENPHIPFREIEHLYRTLPERTFRQEILAEFVDDGGGVFRNVSRCATAAPQVQGSAGHQYIIGADWGRSEDYTVFSVIDARTKRQVAMDRSNKVEYALQRGRLKALAERFSPAVIVAEANAMGLPIIEQLQRDGLKVQPFTTTNATKQEIVDGLALAFEQQSIAILDDAVQTAELQAYSMERLPSGLIRYGAPEGMHDDTVIALALAWYGATLPSGEVRVAENPFY